MQNARNYFFGVSVSFSVTTAIATTITKEIIDHTDDISKATVDIGEEIVLAPLNIACGVLDGIGSLFD